MPQSLTFKLLILLFFIKANSSFHANHNKPFGTGPSISIDFTNGFVDPITFFESFIQKSKPILMKQAARNFPAMKNWDDEYFLNLNLPTYSTKTVNIETRKKENRTLTSMQINFKDFIKSYNDSDIYMVDSLPNFLNEDILYPWPLQCDLFDENIFQVIMWFSSGNTSSVVHTDDMENINCLIRGTKTFVLVDPDKHGDKIPMKNEGAYSDIDVDRVDFSKYKQMENVDFIIAKMEAGDCLYIPKLWIHQVRSFHRNIAINIWFRVPEIYLENSDKTELLKKCNKYPDDKKTFFNTNYLGLNTDIYNKNDSIGMLSEFQNKSVSDVFVTILEVYNDIDPNILMKFSDHIKLVIKEIIDEVDRNRNSIIDDEEIKLANSKNLSRIANYINYLKTFLEGLSIKEESNNLVDTSETNKLKQHNEL